jgi:hypothetical protein
MERRVVGPSLFFKPNNTKIMNKFIMLIFGVYFLPTMLAAQQLSNKVLASAGAYAENSGGSLSYTVGEMTMVNTFSAGNNILTQGFQQPNKNPAGISNNAISDFGSFNVYPVPAIDNLWYSFEFAESGTIAISVYDQLGQKVANVYRADNISGKVVRQLDINSLAAGIYFLKVDFISSATANRHEMAKKFQVIN